MTSYSELKKLDLESLAKIQEGTGPSDKCICSLLAPHEDEKGGLKGVKASIKKAFQSMGGGRKNNRNMRMQGMKSIEVPVSFTKGGKGVYSTKEVMKRKSSCGKCGCDNENFVLKHSYANIKIISPDISSICPCSNDCLPEKSKLANNIKVTVERVTIDPDSVDSEFDLKDDLPKRPILNEPTIEKKSITDLIDQQYDDYQYSDWSFEDDDDDES